MIKEVIEQTNTIQTMEIVGVSTTLPSSSSVFHRLDVDVLVLDCSKDREGAFALGEMIRKDAQLYIRIIYLIDELDGEAVHYLLKNEVNQYLIEPYTVGQLLFKITKETQLLSKNSSVQVKDQEYDSQIMQNLGLPVHLNGFLYIKNAVELLRESPVGTHLTMKRLYKEIARINSTTTTRVEKSIRTSIDYAYRMSPSIIMVQGKKPTNSQIIYLVYERLKMHEMMKKDEEIK